MASKTYRTEAELITILQEAQQRLGGLAQALGSLQADSLKRLRQAGTAGSTITPESRTRINDQINIFNTNMQLELDLILETLFRTFQVEAVGAISSGDQITLSNVNALVSVAPFAGVADASDIPYATWTEDTGDFYLGLQMDPDADLLSTLGLQVNDVVLVQDSNATTDTDHANAQRGRRLLLTDTEDNVSRGGVVLFGTMKFTSDIDTPYAIRDTGALTTFVNDTRLILRKVFDALI